MKRIVNKAKNHKEAGKWDLKQQLEMTSDQRLEVAKALRERFFGKDTVDVRKSRAFSKRPRRSL
jgi:hypothetical protein